MSPESHLSCVGVHSTIQHVIASPRLHHPSLLCCTAHGAECKSVCLSLSVCLSPSLSLSLVCLCPSLLPSAPLSLSFSLLSVCLSSSRPTPFLSYLHLSVCLSVCLSLSLNFPIFRSIHLSTRLSMHHQSAYLSICQRIYLSALEFIHIHAESDHFYLVSSS